MHSTFRHTLLAASAAVALLALPQAGSAQAPASQGAAPSQGAASSQGAAGAQGAAGSEGRTDQPAPGPQIVYVPAPPAGGGAQGAAPAPGVGAAPGVPASTCRPGYTQQGYRLCMSGARGAVQFDNAMLYCQDEGGRVADLSDWRYRIYRGDGVSAPVGFWFGPRTNDDRALFANSSNPGNPDGEASVFDYRGYACAHDLIR